MNIQRQLIKNGGFNVPCIMLKPSNSYGAAVITHGYGGSKEEQLGLAWRTAEMGLTTCVIDLRGHGEHSANLDENILSDVEAAIEYCRAYGKVAAIGHSLGGRLSLISSSDYAVGISPALSSHFNSETQNALKNLRSYRVRETSCEKFFEVMEKLPLYEFKPDKQAAIIYGSRDIQDIILSCNELKSKGTSVIEIKNALHNDIFTLEITFQTVIEQLKKWLSM